MKCLKSFVTCNVLLNCLYVCFCFSLYLYCICCIEEALMLAIDQPLHPHRKYRPPCCDFTAPNLHQMDPTVGQINRRLDLKDLQGKFVPKHFLVRNFEASGQMSWTLSFFLWNKTKYPWFMPQTDQVKQVGVIFKLQQNSKFSDEPQLYTLDCNDDYIYITASQNILRELAL